MASSTPSAAGYGLFLLETAAGLAVLGIAAWALVRFANKRLYSVRPGTRLRLVERLPLNARTALYLVEADGERLLLGVNDRGVFLLKTGKADEKSEIVSSVQTGERQP